MKTLTPNQIWVLESLRHRNCHWLAEIVERAWKRGWPYYIDRRVKALGLRRRFAQGNREAMV
jgi:hypothetical protein